MHQITTKIANSSPNPAEFTQKYNDLKIKNVRDVDALVFLLGELSGKPDTPLVKKMFAPKSSVSSLSTYNDATLNSESGSSGTVSKFSFDVLSEVFIILKFKHHFNLFIRIHFKKF